MPECIHQTLVHSEQLSVHPKHGEEISQNENASPLHEAGHTKGL